MTVYRDAVYVTSSVVERRETGGVRSCPLSLRCFFLVERVK